jgi:hypothetical protein
MIKRFKDVDNYNELIHYEKNIENTAIKATQNYLKNLKEVKEKTLFRLSLPKNKECPLLNFKMTDCDFHYQDGTVGTVQIF